jgi:hypothetical protein
MPIPVLQLSLIVLTSIQTSSAAQKHWSDKIKLTSSMESVIGSGSFIESSKTDDPYYSTTLSLTPNWQFNKHLSVAAHMLLTYEWTVLVTPCSDSSSPRPIGAPQYDCSDTSDPSGRRLDWSDLRFVVQHDHLYKFFGIEIGADGGLSLPTSIASQASDNLFTLDVNGQLSRQLGPLSINLGLGAAKFFPLNNAATLDAADVNNGATPIGHCPSFRQTNCILLSGFVPSWRISGDFSLSIEVPQIEELSAGIGVSYAYSSRHGREPDQFSSSQTDRDGVPIVDGSNASDTTSGYFEVSYEITDRFTSTLGVSSGQPARTEDGRSIRFPFYDFISPANNYSGYYLSFSHSI